MARNSHQSAGETGLSEQTGRAACMQTEHDTVFSPCDYYSLSLYLLTLVKCMLVVFIPEPDQPALQTICVYSSSGLVREAD